MACIFLGLWKIPYRNILTPAPSITGNLILPNWVFVNAFERKRENWEGLHMCAQVNRRSGFMSDRNSSCSPRGLLSVWKPKGLEAEDAKQIYLLASCRLRGNKIQSDMLKTNTSVASPLSVSSSGPIEFFWETLTGCQGLFFVEWGLSVKQTGAGWVNVDDAIIRLNLEYTRRQTVWWEHFLQNNESRSSSDRDRDTERGRERKNWKRYHHCTACTSASVLLGNRTDRVQFSLLQARR